MLTDADVREVRADLLRVGWDEVDETLATTHEQAQAIAPLSAGLTLAELEQRVQLLTGLAVLQQALLEQMMRRVLADTREPRA